MKRLIPIILALIVTFFTVPNNGAKQPHVTAVKTPQAAITTTAEQSSKKSKQPQKRRL